MSTPERAGWYDDPEDETQLRYFDGIIWSERTVPRQTRAAQPTPETAPQGDPAVDPSAPGTQGGQGSPGGPGTDVFGRPTHGAGQTPFGTAPQGAAGYGDAAPEPTTADGQTLASYGQRVGAYLVDWIVLRILNVIFAGWAVWLASRDYLTFIWDAAAANDPERLERVTPEELLGLFDVQYLLVALGIGMLVRCLYEVIFLSRWAATPGKLALGLSVRRVDRPGWPSAGTAFMRALLPMATMLLSAISCFSTAVTAADLLWPIKDPQRQTLHDKIAGTLVVRGRQEKASCEAGTDREAR